MVTDSVLMDIARISGLPFDVVEQKFREQGAKTVNVDVNGVTSTQAEIYVTPNWGPVVKVSNVTDAGVVVQGGHVYISANNVELVVDACHIRRAISAVLDIANNKEGDAWW